MIHRIVQSALQQRFLVLMLVVFIGIGGAVSFQRMPVDAYPDLSPPMVEIITQWPGHAAEEVERLVTLPTEVEMNGVPKMEIQRSISLYGLSDVILTFDEDTDDYFARQVVFQRLSEVSYPTGVTPTLAPLSSPSGLVYRYVLQSPDRTPQELKTFEDWVIEREYKQVRGVADDSGFGGTVMQYQVLLDPARLYGYHITVPQVIQQLSVNNANTGGGFYPQGGQFYYVRGLGLIKDVQDIGSVIIGSQNGVPVRVRDVAEVTIGHAPRLGQFGFNKNDDAVEGVIMMLRGEQTQNVLKGVEAKTKELNEHILPPDVKVLPYYDRSDLVRLTIDTVEKNMLLGMTLVLIVLIFFLVSVRAAVIVALTIPVALLFSFIFLHARGVAANLLSIGAIDFGIIIDGTLVMVENIYRELGLREGQKYDLHEVILTAARDVDRPIFYSVAIIIAGYIPIYALSGPSGKLFHPMADTMSVALIGALILTLTFVPVMCSYWFKKGVREPRNKPFEWIKKEYGSELKWCLERPWLTMLVATIIFAVSLLFVPFIGGEFMPHLDEGALWVRATMPYTISYEEAAKVAPQIRTILAKYPMVTDVGSELGRPDDGTDPTGFFNCEFYVGLKPYGDSIWKSGNIHNKAELIEDLQKQLAAFPGIIFNYTQPAEDAVDEALTGLKSALAVKVYGADLNVLAGQSAGNQTATFADPRLYRTHRRARTRPAQPDRASGSRQDRPLRHQRRRRGSSGASSRRRPGSHAGNSRREVIRPCRAHETGIPRERATDLEPARRRSHRSADSPQRAGGYSRRQRRVFHLSRTKFALHRRAIQHRRPRPRRSRRRRQARYRRRGKNVARGLPPRVGRGIQRIYQRDEPGFDRRAAHRAADFHDPVRSVREFEISSHRGSERDFDRTGRSINRLEADAYSVQRFFTARIAGVDGRLGGDRSH